MAATGFTPISIYTSTTATNTPLAANLVNGELAINIVDGKLFYKDSTGAVQKIAILSRTNGNFGDLTGALTLPIGTTAQEPVSPVEGMIRYNSTTKQFEGYSQVNSVSGWYSVGGSSITNDTTASTAYYPLYAKATSGTAQVVYTANTEYTFKPSTGELTSPVMISSNGLSVNSSTVASSYTIQTGQNAMSVGPITVASGQSVTVSSGQRWVVL